ncbi:MAG: IS110 family transposase [Pseudomonadota bacterium]
MQATTIGLDLAKNIFQVHGVTADGTTLFNRPVRRAQLLKFFEKQEPCLVGMEACATSHYWARELTKLGHEVRLMAPGYVKPYVKRGKSDAADAEAICEAVTRPTMRTVPIKTPEQQAVLCQHRARELLIGQRTQLSNIIRGLVGEFGYTLRKGLSYIRAFAEELKNGRGPDLPDVAADVIASLCKQLLTLHRRILTLEKKIFQAARRDRRVKLLETIPGIGPVSASAIIATVGTPDNFKSGRDFAAWIGLTPLNKSSGGRERLGKITRMGDQYLRKLLVTGMTSRVRAAKAHPERADRWVANLLERKPVRLATVAMANKTARIIWAVLTRNEPYRNLSAA